MQALHFLYDNDYEIVLQDAEKILQDIVDTRVVSIDEFRKKYRFNDYHIRKNAPDLTEEERALPAGSVIMRGKEVGILRKSGEENYHRFHMISAGYIPNWNLS